MKTLLSVVIAAAMGTVIGFGIAMKMFAGSSPSEKVETKQLILVDPKGRAAVRMVATEKETAIRFYSADSKLALEIGVDNTDNPYRYLRMYGPTGEIASALNSDTRAKGATTLYLGDEITSRVVAGSLEVEDVPTIGERTIQNWGLAVRRPGKNLFEASMHSPSKLSDSTAAVKLEREDGTTWTVH